MEIKIKMKKLNIFLITFISIGLLYSLIVPNFANHSALASTRDAKLIMRPKTQTIPPGGSAEIEIVISNPSSQNIITTGFDISFPSNLLEVIDSDPSSEGIKINGSGTKFSINDPALNMVSNTNGTINFTAGTQGTNPINDLEIKVATIQFRAKTNISTQIADIEFIPSQDTDIIIKNANNDTESILSQEQDGLQNADIVISNINYSLSPSYKKLEIGEDFSIDIILNNPDQKEIIAFAFELNFDSDRLKANNTSITINQSANMQVVENEVVSGDKIIFTAGFTGNNPFTQNTLTIGNISFESKKSGTANLRFNPNSSSSSVFLKNDSIHNFLGNLNPGKYVIGDEESEDEPYSWADPKGGTYTQPINVKLSSNDNRADIYFTLDESTPTDRSTKYRNLIPIDKNTTLKFFAVDQNGNEEKVNTEKYIIGGQSSNYAIGLTAAKNELKPGEQTGIIIKVIDTTTNQPVKDKKINLSNSGSGSFAVIGNYNTDEEGEVLVTYTAGAISGEDVVTASLQDDPSVQGHLNLKILGDNITRILLVGHSLNTTKTNFLSATLENSPGKKIDSIKTVELKVNKKGNTEKKTFTANTINGTATFGIEGSEFEKNTTYEFIATSEGVESNKIELTTEPITSSSTQQVNPSPRPGGGQPNTGPMENIFMLFAFSLTLVFFFKNSLRI
jgi:hypothetical protein